MFTGIITAVGHVRTARPFGSCSRIKIEEPDLAKETQLGDSIAIDGVCLTVVDLEERSFSVDVGPETANRSTLGRIGTGDPVNLEPALRLGDRLGGHLVLGHVDGKGRVTRVDRDGEATLLTIAYSGPGKHLVVSKGSVAIHGASLTVAGTQGDEFTISVIPYTLGSTTISNWSAGREVNVEIDVIARYVEALAGRDEGKDLTDLLKGAWRNAP